MRDTRIAEARTLDEAVQAAASGWARIPWATVGPSGEARLAENAIIVRCLVRPTADEAEPDLIAHVGRAYQRGSSTLRGSVG